MNVDLVTTVFQLIGCFGGYYIEELPVHPHMRLRAWKAALSQRCDIMPEQVWNTVPAFVRHNTSAVAGIRSADA